MLDFRNCGAWVKRKRVGNERYKAACSGHEVWCSDGSTLGGSMGNDPARSVCWEDHW